MGNDGRSLCGSSEDYMQRQGGIAHAIRKQFALLLGHEHISRLFFLEFLHIVRCEFQNFVALPAEKV